MASEFTITGVKKKASLHGGTFYYIFFKGDDVKSYRTCVYQKMGNFKRWEAFCIQDAVGKVLTGLVIKQGTLIDADSRPTMIR